MRHPSNTSSNPSLSGVCNRMNAILKLIDPKTCLILKNHCCPIYTVTSTPHFEPPSH